MIKLEIPSCFVGHCSIQHHFAEAQLLLVEVLPPSVEFGHLSVVYQLPVAGFEYLSAVVQWPSAEVVHEVVPHS
jgi:hypothetical protein